MRLIIAKKRGPKALGDPNTRTVRGSDPNVLYDFIIGLPRIFLY